MWGTFLSEPLPIIGTVGLHPAVYLIGRIPIPIRKEPFVAQRGRKRDTWGINPPFGGLCPG